MSKKRDDRPDEPSSVKRRKLSEHLPSESQSPRILTEPQKAGLINWLDQADKKDGPIFTVISPSIRKGAKKPADSMVRPLILNEKVYLEARWAIKPVERWHQMTKYKKFTVGNQTHSCGDCVLVKPGNDSGKDWKAQVHEVRAADEHHVFLRCTWLENPDELPEEVLSTPPYHGRFELVPGNKMDIIDALTVNGPLKVSHWDEADDDAKMPEAGEYFWRQTYDYDTKVLSPLRPICECKRPHNPDRLIIKCSNKDCGIWLHASCLAQNAVRGKQQAQDTKNESGAKTGKKSRKSNTKINGTEFATDDAGTSAEDEHTKAEVMVPDTEAPVVLITNKANGEETKEPVHCLVCEALIN